MQSDMSSDSILTPNTKRIEEEEKNHEDGEWQEEHQRDVGGESDSIDNDVDVDEDKLYAQAVNEQAKLLGIDPEKESYLMHIAEMALLSPPPEGWSEEHLPEGGTFFAHVDGKTTEENPMLEHFKAEVIRERGKHIDSLMHLQSSNLRNNSQPKVHGVQEIRETRDSHVVTQAKTSSPPMTSSSSSPPPRAPRVSSSPKHPLPPTKVAAHKINTNLSGDSIECILSRRKIYSKSGAAEYEYKVHWFGSQSTDDEWFLRSSLLADYRQLVEDFDEKMERKGKREKKGLSRDSMLEQDLGDSNTSQSHRFVNETTSQGNNEGPTRRLRLQLMDLEMENERLRRQLREVSEDRDSLRRTIEILAQHAGTVKIDLGVKHDETSALRRQNRLLRQDIMKNDYRGKMLHDYTSPSVQDDREIANRVNTEYTNSLLADADRRNTAAYYDKVWHSALRHHKYAQDMRLDNLL